MSDVQVKINFLLLILVSQNLAILSELCGPVVVGESWMQTYFGFNFSAAETKSHCHIYHGYEYIRMKIQERACRRLHLPPKH